MRGQLTVAGWSYSEDLGIEAVELMLNGETIHSLHHGVPRPDVVSKQGVMSDPNRPNLGFTGTLDSLNVANGTYTLSLRLRNRAGEAELWRATNRDRQLERSEYLNGNPPFITFGQSPQAQIVATESDLRFFRVSRHNP